MNPHPTEPCPCGAQVGGTARQPKPASYADCCGRYLEHYATTPAPDAERLMRSRYTAFVLQRRDYLLATWHASTRPATLELDADARWLGLQVRSHRAMGENRAEVEFVARYRQAGRGVRLHEKSRFVHEAGRWYYVDGNID